MRSRSRQIEFKVIDDHLIRAVTFKDGAGKDYQHRCELAVYEKVAHAVAETPREGKGTDLGDIVERENIPFTQANVAFEFLKERGVAVTRSRQSYPASDFAYEDAMIEYHALREGATGPVVLSLP